MKALGQVQADGGLLDGANRAYSDSNPPETLMHTDFPSASVVTPPTGFSVVFTSDGRVYYAKDNDGVVRPLDMSWENCPFSHVGALTVKTGTSRYPIKGGTFQIQTIAAALNTPATGSTAIVDVNKNGASIYGTQANRPTFPVSVNNATVGAHTATTVADGDYLTIDIDQIGSTVAGSDLTVVVRMQRII